MFILRKYGKNENDDLAAVEGEYRSGNIEAIVRGEIQITRDALKSAREKSEIMFLKLARVYVKTL